MTSPGNGAILAGLATVPDLARALAGYRDTLGLEVVEEGALEASLAAGWGCPASAGAPLAVLRPRSGAPFWMRLVEQPAHQAFRPTTTYGWAAYELSVEDVFAWPAKLEGSVFEVIGPPKTISGLEPAFIPMQVLGSGSEMLYLNQVLADMPALDLPRAAAPIDRAFIVVLAAPDRRAAVAWYRDALGLEEGDSFTIPYTMINRAFDLPPEHMTTLTMIQAGRNPVVEIDDYPPAAQARPSHAGCLPPGNALVTLAVRSLEACGCPWIAEPARRPEPPYGGRRSATARGPAGELVELVEVG